jgi:hypothetical protein
MKQPKKQSNKKVDTSNMHLKEIVLSPDVNSIKSPSTVTASTKLGSKSLDEIQRQRDLQIMNDPYFLSNEFMAKMSSIRKEKERLAAEALVKWEHNNAIAQAERRAAEKAATIKHLQEYYAANPTARSAKIQEDKIKQDEHQDILNKLNRQKNRDIERLTIWFEKPFISYDTTTLEASPVSKIISTRKFASDRFGHQRFCYRSIPAGYSQPESLSLRTIEAFIHQDRIRSERALLDSIESEYAKKISKLKAEWRNEDDLDVKNVKLDEDIKRLGKIKTRAAQN